MVSGSDNNDAEQLPLNLLDNALDFLLSAAEAVHRDEGLRSLKDAVTHLGNGIESLFKARLARENLGLISPNIGQASYDKLDKADLKSVNFPKAVARLGKVDGVRIAEPDISHINDLRKLRNRLTHSIATLEPAQTKSLVAKSMNFCVEFCEQQDMVSPDAKSKLGEIHKNLAELQEFADDRMKAISSGRKYPLVWKCPNCLREALDVDVGKADCKFCNHKADPQELAASLSEVSVKDCLECDAKLTLAFLYDNDGDVWVCFACGVSCEQYAHCEMCRCMEPFSDNDGVTICKSCRLEFFNNR